LAALSDGISVIRSPLESDDTLATLNVLRGLGVTVESENSDTRIGGGHLFKPRSALSCGESGTTMRFTCSVASLVNGDTTLTGGPSLSSRPMAPLLKALKQAGVRSSSTNGYPPVTIHGECGIRGGEVEVVGDVSSQFVSSLLMVAPLANTPMKIVVTTRLESKPYVQMTIDAMKSFGIDVNPTQDLRLLESPQGRYKSREIKVEGDWSSAAYMVAAGVLGGDVVIKNLNTVSSSQADKKIIDILSQMDADLRIGENEVESRKCGLSPVEYDLKDSPDLFPVMSALCSQAEGTSKLTGLSRLRIKESDRVKSMAEGLRRMGVTLKVKGDIVEINGSKLRGATVNPYADHRIAMSFAVLSLVTEGATTILNAECVSKSYPEFWSHMSNIGTQIRRMGDE
jgi:3-phosphoshikimate 1-carboxyvinyltransferase